MEPRIVTKQAFTVMGVQERCNPDTAGFEDIWMKRFMSFHDKVSPLSTDKAYYGVWFATDEKGMMDYVAGMAVGEVESVPEGLVVRDVPAGGYAVFEGTLKTIGETYDYAFGEWLPTSGYHLDKKLPAFEHYPPDTKGQDDPVSIYVPVQHPPAE